ncbi:Fe2+-enterobactin ABC transporter substrate-binding protein [Martelella alba]|uniref:Fe2+-enterobactin ABC transporter substrate-binding protein n=1 Tax=Martelella alba TaxID=2590451 RepID=A0ABY2SLQ4_9HYPH|nr:Fe2+-enterobactin ABC transporter substrate-binding protein [Martelella alba]TKI06123.1 Fe2+-enterobactin ABC transporter substrate-binding protein [Martelella alba]
MFGATFRSRVLFSLGAIVLLTLSHRGNAADWPRRIAGTRGDIVLQQAPKRILSTSVTLTGTLLAIDAPVIASGATTPNNAVADQLGFLRQWGDVARQRGVKRLYIGEPDAEAIAGEAPDLIVMSATGGDSALRLYPQLSAIAPVLVLNYDNQSWQQLAVVLGRATGHETQAAHIVDAFDVRVRTLGQRLASPPQPVSALVYLRDGKGANLWTADSPQGRLLAQLGFSLAKPPANLSTGHSMGQRRDILQLSGENLADGLNGRTLLLFAAEKADADALRANPFLAHLPAVRDGQVFALGRDTFRLDYFSASNVLTRLEKLFSRP